MIVGIGADLCRVSRIEHSLRRFGDSFAQTFCSPREFEYAKAQSNPAVAFALCFATKEAFAKAAGTGFNADLWWDDVETVFNHDGRAQLLIDADVATCLQARLGAPAGIKVHVTTSANAELCSAFVVIDRI